MLIMNLSLPVGSICLLLHMEMDFWLNASFGFQVWEEDCGGLFYWL